jgi:hypothetical protein
VVLICGVRSGKSFFAVCGATRDILNADCSALRPHEIARHVIVAPNTDAATATFRLFCGMWGDSPPLKALIIGEPTTDTLTIRRPDGRIFEVTVVAASRGAVTVRNRWLAGFTYEEASGFGVEATGAAVNAEELLRAGQTRLLPRTQGRIITSPYGQQGLVWRLYREHFGSPGRVLVVHAATRAMNPSFPQATIDEIRARDPDGAAREYDAAWVDPESAFFDSETLRCARREAPLERAAQQGVQYVAAWDAATRGNRWTLAVAHEENGRVIVDLVREWRGSKTAPLSPKIVIGEVAAVLRPFRVRSVYVDQWSVDALRDQAGAVGLGLIECAKDITDAGYRELHTRLGNASAELPPHDVLEQDLRGVRKRVTPTGVRIELPRTADGRHCDYAPAVALAVHFATLALNTSGIGERDEESDAWEYGLGAPVIAVTVAENGDSSALAAQWVELLSNEDPDVMINGVLARNPRWFERRVALRILGGANLPPDIEEAAEFVVQLARETGVSRVWVDAGPVGAWKIALRGLSVRDSRRRNRC